MYEDIVKKRKYFKMELPTADELYGPKNQPELAELAKLTKWLLSTDRYNSVYGNPVDQVIHSIENLETQIDALAAYLLKNFGGDIQEGGAVENVIRLLKLYSNRCE